MRFRGQSLCRCSRLALVIGYFDYIAGTDTTFSAIYLFPIALAAWFVNLPAAYALSI
jgi:hypothetical protein